MTDTRKWSALAAVLVVAVFAAGWFLLISPKRDEAANLRQRKVTQEEANARLQQQIQVLQAQQRDLPQQQAKLAAMKVQIPDNPALPSLIRDLTAAGRKVGVSVDSMAPTQPQALVANPAVAAPAAGGAAGAATGSTQAGAATTGTTTGPAAVTSTLYQVPLTLNVTGSYFELEQFLNKLEGLKRSLLVSGFSITPSTAEDAVDGDLTISLTSRVFLAQDGAAAASTTPVAAATTTSTE